MRFKIIGAILIALMASIVSYNLAFADQLQVKQKLFGPTKPSDTLSAIAKHLVPPHSSITLNQVMVALYANNIAAFSKGNMNVLLKNKWLKIPSVSEIRAIAPAQASLIVRHHELAWLNKETLSPKYTQIKLPALKVKDEDVSASSITTLKNDHALAVPPPKELTMPYTPLLRPVASLNFVFVAPDELQRVQKDKVLPLVLKPAVLAQQIQLLSQEPMSALQTFDMWTLLSTQFQELANRFDQIEKDQKQIQIELNALKQQDKKQNHQIEALQQQLQNLIVASKANSVTRFADLQFTKLVDFFVTLNDIFPVWTVVVAVFATLLLLLMAISRYMFKKRALNSTYEKAVPKEKTAVPGTVTDIEPTDKNVTPEPESTEIRVRPKEGSLHEAVAEILTTHNQIAEKNEVTDEVMGSDFAVEDEISSLLDLARAYSDMGDHENAKILIDRIIAEGNEIQRKDAQQLIEQLPQ